MQTLAEEGAYHRSIRIDWKYGSVPKDPKILALRIGKRCTVKIASAVLAMFEPMPGNPDRMIHPTVEKIRAEQYQKYLNRVKGGKASAKTRSKQRTSSITPALVSDAQTTVDQHSNRKENKIEIQIQNKEGYKRLIATLASEFPKIDQRIIEIGALYTLGQRTSSADRISSTKYFHSEIKKRARDSKSLGDEALDFLLWRRSEQVWGERDVRRPDDKDRSEMGQYD